ncbi:hypothetical protein LY78DRAFT_384412 [Colletotrichum sublineola]|nr:hypothetical protein LY78DRAFT_384412 [Colletotrichum sublineola]
MPLISAAGSSFGSSKLGHNQAHKFVNHDSDSSRAAGPVCTRRRRCLVLQRHGDGCSTVRWMHLGLQSHPATGHPYTSLTMCGTAVLPAPILRPSTCAYMVVARPAASAGISVSGKLVLSFSGSSIQVSMFALNGIDRRSPHHLIGKPIELRCCR